jgi:hypothetical protein
VNCTVFYGTHGQGIRQELNLIREVIMASLRKRGSVYYLSYYVGGKEIRTSLDTDSFQIAKERQRQFESAQLRGENIPLPTRTPIADIVTAYVNHIRTVKTPKSAQTDIYYPPKVFVSSTCYDLKQIRADLRQFIDSLGFEPMLSEFDSFPVDTSLKAVENCIERVQSEADILVLVVGGRYGSTVPSGKSITNLEYLQARAKGIPVYVFVEKSVLSVLEIWRVNRTADFNNVVDSTQLFEFVASMRDKGEVWIFAFESAQDIISTLRKQLAFLCGDAMRFRTRANAAGLSDAARQLHGPALKLIVERPLAWQYRVFSQVLADEIEKSADIKRDVELGVAVGRGPRVRNAAEVADWASTHFREALKITNLITTLINTALPDAAGATGAPDNPDAVIYIARKVADQYRAFLEWILDCRRLNVDPDFQRLTELIANFARNTIQEIEQFSQQLQTEIAAAIEGGIPAGESRTVELTLKLTMPDTTDYKTELDRLIRNISR